CPWPYTLRGVPHGALRPRGSGTCPARTASVLKCHPARERSCFVPSLPAIWTRCRVGCILASLKFPGPLTDGCKPICDQSLLTTSVGSRLEFISFEMLCTFAPDRCS